ncbi:MAG: hypothetical protein NUV80_01070 [Candidatus Berkelbacteria bacterium]|nr:hypothetical protein [Candidatus Berkelbacteria bacterium]
MRRTTRKEYLNREFAKAIEEADGPTDMTEEEKKEWQMRKINRELIKRERLELL